MKRRLLNIGIAIDQLILTVLSLGGAYPDETLSSFVHRRAFLEGKIWVILEAFINKIFFWEEEHCEKAYYAEMERRQAPREYIIRK